MTDRPILFSAPMVRALLDGRKTQTRRVFKVQPVPVHLSSERQEDSELRGLRCDPLADGRFIVTKPRFAVGDRLWVRETFSFIGGDGVFELSQARMTGRYKALYRADHGVTADRWWPGIHMPREFSRLTLTVTDVRVQRLQEISREDAAAEGVVMPPTELYPDVNTGSKLRRQFEKLWISINGPDAWSANPWVVALTFTVERRNIDTPPASGARGD